MDFKESVSSLKAAVLVSLCGLTVALNALVIFVIWKDPFKELQGTANYLILNLAICDLLVGCPGELLFGLIHWIPDHNVTRVAYIALYLAFFASLFTILGLAVERLIVISSPFNCADYLTSSYLAIGITSIWLLAGMLAFLPIGWDSFDGYRLFIIDGVCLPIIILLFASYARIYFLVRKSLYLNLTTSEERRLEGQVLAKSSREAAKLKRKERSVAFSVFILVSILTVCWIPVSVVENINEFCKSYNYKLEVPECFICLQPLANPIAYSLRTAKFRKALRIIFRGLCVNPNKNNGSPRHVFAA